LEERQDNKQHVDAEGKKSEVWRLIDLPKITDRRGNLTFLEGMKHVPFDIKRIYYLYDVPGGESRGGHAHRITQQFMVSMSGCFDVLLKDGRREEIFTLNRSYYGLYIPQMTWRELFNFSSGAVCLVVASTPYSESDYIRNFDEFLNIVRKNGGNKIN
jgi:dTDP-4-dehydrorhamnose 3,5-epimerase-like enzyme